MSEVVLADEVETRKLQISGVNPTVGRSQEVVK